jgi:drug/metabolite transporter (DMT)-like permease
VVGSTLDNSEVKEKTVEVSARSDWNGLVYVGLAVFLFSTSPLLIRWAAPLSPFEITFGRMAVAALAVGVMAIVTGQKLALPLASGPRFLLYGLIAAIHFACYVAAISMTTVAHALTLTYTSPIFVTLFSAWFLKEPIARIKYLGVAVVIAGTAILAGFEPQLTPQMMMGDALAVASAIAFGLYSVAGRFERQNLPLLTYAAVVYGAAALWMLPAAVATRTEVWLWTSGLAVVGQGILLLAIGHTLYNASLRRAHATYVNLVSTQEVTGGVLLGWLVLQEIPSSTALVGAVVTLAGVIMVLGLGNKDKSQARQPDISLS